MALQHEIFGVNQPDVRRTVHDDLSNSLDMIISLGMSAPQKAEANWQLAEDCAFGAIHRYADLYNIGVDEDGMEQRRDFAKAINAKLRRGINPFTAQIIDDPVMFTEQSRNRGLLHEPGSEISADAEQRFDSKALPVTGEAYASASMRGYEDLSEENFDDKAQLEPGLFGVKSMPMQSDEVHPEPRESKLRRKVTKAVAAVALAGIAIFGISRCSTSDEKGVALEKPVATTQSIDTTQYSFPTTTTSQPESIVTAPVTTLPNLGVDVGGLSSPGVMILPPAEASSAMAVVVPEGSSVWRELREGIVSQAISRQEADKRILDALPYLRKDNPNISNLSEINAGQVIEVGPDTMSVLYGNVS